MSRRLILYLVLKLTLTGNTGGEIYKTTLILIQRDVDFPSLSVTSGYHRWNEYIASYTIDSLVGQTFGAAPIPYNQWIEVDMQTHYRVCDNVKCILDHKCI